MEAIDLPQHRVRRCLRPRDIVGGVTPVAVERDFGIAQRPLEARNAAMRVDANGAFRRGAGTAPRDVRGPATRMRLRS